jgi:hypothetical protein
MMNRSAPQPIMYLPIAVAPPAKRRFRKPNDVLVVSSLRAGTPYS